MPKKIRVGILFGGCSAEHEVSLQSAQNVINALDKTQYEVVLIGIDKQGKWHVNEDPTQIKLNHSNHDIGLIPGRYENQFLATNNQNAIHDLDVVFPILHGPLGEDGSIQGLLRLANLPFVGSSILGSAICMDKDITKKLLKQAGLPVCDYVVVKKSDPAWPNFLDLRQQLGETLFVKPANMGSSIGISKVTHEHDFKKAIETAFLYDHKILIEAYVPGKELEISILGNDDPIASAVGEIIPKSEYYSYEAKYAVGGLMLEIPAKIDQTIHKRLKTYALKAFKALECCGLARCDFFLTKDHNLIINEINTMPGFTKTSVYPKLWAASGISYSELTKRLIQCAMERYSQDQELKTYL